MELKRLERGVLDPLNFVQLQVVTTELPARRLTQVRVCALATSATNADNKSIVTMNATVFIYTPP